MFCFVKGIAFITESEVVQKQDRVSISRTVCIGPVI
jgi:hypothetical protein